MEGFPKLNFPQCSFRITTEEGDGQMRIWDDLRRLWLVLTHEEWVRQHLVRALIEQMGVAPQLIVQEHLVVVQGMNQRADVVVFGRDGKAVMLAECKAPLIELDASVYSQALRYNNVVDARYILITNGLRHFVYEHNADGSYSALSDFPEL